MRKSNLISLVGLTSALSLAGCATSSTTYVPKPTAQIQSESNDYLTSIERTLFDKFLDLYMESFTESYGDDIADISEAIAKKYD